MGKLAKLTKKSTESRTMGENITLWRVSKVVTLLLLFVGALMEWNFPLVYLSWQPSWLSELISEDSYESIVRFSIMGLSALGVYTILDGSKNKKLDSIFTIISSVALVAYLVLALLFILFMFFLGSFLN